MKKYIKPPLRQINRTTPSIFFLFLVIGPIILSLTLFSVDTMPQNESLLKYIRNTFYISGKPDKGKINRFRTKINHRLLQISKNLENHYFFLKKFSKIKTKIKTNKEKEVRVYRILLETLDRLEVQTDPVLCQKLAIKILRLEYALKVSARKLPSVELIEKIPFSFKSKRIPLSKESGHDATNLSDPKTGEIYDQNQLKNLRRQGIDTSRLNPHSDSSLWIKQDISNINVKQFYSNAKDELHKGLKVVFPDKKAWFKGIRKTQSKPKLDLYFYHKGRKQKLKIKLAREVHSEITCAALMTTLGYSADSTKYVRDFKIVLGRCSFQEFRREWKSYYGSYNPDTYIKKQGKDQDGNYIIFHEAVLEAKHSKLIRVGPWAYGALWNRNLREVRACLLFNMWVGNLDVKESENNKVILKKTGKGYRLYQIQHDMGFAFGKTHMERPGAFQWNLVKKITDKSIHFNFNCIVNNSLFKSVNYDDSRWMARLIARLSRKQISDAVSLGGWPDPLGKLLVEKLIARRNQLVRAFKLTGEKTPEGDRIALMNYNRSINSRDGALKKGKLKTYRFEGYPQYFGPRINEFIALLLKGLQNFTVDSIVNLTASVKYIELDPENFGLDPLMISKVVLRMNRRIETNPNPLSRAESYLVKDHLQLGLQLGYGSIISGNLTYWRKYTLVYPVATRNAGRFHGDFILHLLLPFRYRGRHIKGNHVVLIEDYLEGRGKVRLKTFSKMLECSLTASRIYLNRYIVGFKNDAFNKYLYYIDDRSQYNELKFRVFFELFNLFRSTPLNIYSQSGILKRKMVYLDLKDIDVNKKKQYVLDQLLLNGNMTPMLAQGIHRNLYDRFKEKKTHLKLLGLIRLKSVFRVDRIKIDSPSLGINKNFKSDNVKDPSLKETYYFQIESSKLKSWRFFDNGERHYNRIRLSSKMDKKGSIIEPVLSVSLQINDQSTHNGELKNSYLNLINSIALDKNFINFDPTIHSSNMLWGNTISQININMYKEGIIALIQASESKIWNTLTKVTGKKAKYWRKLSRNVFRKTHSHIRYSKDKYLAVKTRYFIRELRKALKSYNSQKKMKHIVKAVKKAIYISGQTFNPILLAVIHHIAGNENFYMTAKVFMPKNKELIFPSRVPLYNETGIKRGPKLPVFQFIFDDPSEIYNFNFLEK